METDVFKWLESNAPWALVIIVVISIIAWGLRILNDFSPTVKKILGPIGRHWEEKSARRFIRSGADYENMHKQILYLYGRVHFLEYESQLDHMFRREDETWHRKVDLKIGGEELPTRTSYEEFQEQYRIRFPYRKPDVDGSSF